MLNKLSRELRRTVYSLARPEGRMVGTSGHQRAREYLCKKLEAMGCVPYSGNDFDLTYRRDKRQFHNLIGVVPGTNRRKKPILIGAHYDSVIAAPCADDNAAAVAIALEVGQILQKEPAERDTIIALFDAEEPPYFETASMGSIRFVKDQLNSKGVHAALIMDLVGHSIQIPLSSIPGHQRLPVDPVKGIPIPGLKNLLFITGTESHSGMKKVIESAKRPSFLPTILTLNSYVDDMSDHGAFRRSGVPYLFLSCGRWQHYHETTDTPDRLNYPKMARITRYVESLVRTMSDTPLTRRPDQETDTLALEIQSLKRSLGPALPIALKFMRLQKIQTRADIDALVEALLSTGL